MDAKFFRAARLCCGIGIAALAVLVALAACAPRRLPPRTPATPRPPSGPSPSAGPTAPPAPAPLTPPVIRIGLMTDLEVWKVPYGNGRLRVTGPFGPFGLHGSGAPEASRTSHTWQAEAVEVGFEVEGDAPARRTVFQVQVAALGNLERARELAADIEKRFAQPVDLPFHAEAGAYQVRAGRFTEREDAEAFAARLTAAGFDKGLIASAVDPAASPVRFFLSLGTERHPLAAGEYRVTSLDKDAIVLGEKGYRGELAVFVNSRGKLNLVNVIGIEDYLKGVVPNEMGPKVFDELEALEAQAVAARTYALASLNMFPEEGYDLCPTPRCQVYSGYLTEHPLSNQAVEATRGEILTYEGKPINALYTSTCGGHTEDVWHVFPEWRQPYLRGVPCLEGESFVLETQSESGNASDGSSEMAGRRTEVPGLVIRRTFADGLAGLGAEPDGAAIAAFVDRAAAGLDFLPAFAAEATAPPARLVSNRRGEVYSYLVERFRLAEDLRWNAPESDFGYLFPAPAWRGVPARLESILVLGVRWKLWPAPASPAALAEPLSTGELATALEAILRRYEIVREVSGKVRQIDGRTILLRVESQPQSFELPADVLLVAELNGVAREVPRLELVFGDRLRVVTFRGVVKVVISETNPQGLDADRTSNWREWTRIYTKTELTKLIRARNPIGELLGIEIKKRGPSGRSSEVAISHPGGVLSLTGLEIRWSLGVPDNLFSMRVTRSAAGEPVYHFFGKAWGHGVGMCQVGAYGLAVRGLGHEAILKHYYSGVSLSRNPEKP